MSVDEIEVTIEEAKAEILDYMKDNEEPNVGQICSFYGMIYDPKTDTYSQYDIKSDTFSFYKFNHGKRPTFIPVELSEELEYGSDEVEVDEVE